MAINLLSIISFKSLTADEIVLTPAGYYQVAAGNFSLVTEHPPLVKTLSALPLLLILSSEAAREDSRAVDKRELAYHFWLANREHLAAVTFWSRIPMIALALALGVLIFTYTRRLFTPRAGVFAVLFFSLEPNILAHSHVVQTDVAVAFAYLLFFVVLHAYVKKPTGYRAGFLGIVLGLALATKFSMIILPPVFILAQLILILIAPQRGQSRIKHLQQAGIVVLCSIVTVNAAYCFHRQPLDESQIRIIAAYAPQHADAIFQAVNLLSIIIPTEFIAGLAKVRIHTHTGHPVPAALLGDYSDRGWWYYFPVAYALKTTIPFLIVSIAGCGWAAWRFIKDRKLGFLFLLIPITIYTAVAMSSSVNIGIRHFLPVFPFLFILAGAFLDSMLRSDHYKVALAAVLLAVGWMCVEYSRTYPNYIPYMNQLAWRHPKWYYLSDSNVEWGEDVGQLASYLRARGESKVRAALLGADPTLSLYGVESIGLFAPPGLETSETRYVAIGASYLNGSSTPKERRQEIFRFYEKHRPEIIFGNSIYLYRMEE